MLKIFFIFSILSLFCNSLLAKTIIYQVPVEDETLLDASFYEINDYNLKTINGKKIIEYSLPVELTGNDEKLIFTAKNKDSNSIHYFGDNTKKIEFKGKNGSLSCSANLTICNVKYKKLKINPVIRDQKLLDLNLDPVFLKKKIQVSRIFEGDPIGIIHQ